MTRELHIQDLSINDIAARFGTPAYVYDADVLTRGLTLLRERMHPRLEFFYSLKANPNIAVYSVLKAAGARAEVSSLAELTTVLRAGTAPRDVLFLGPGKSTAEITACVTASITLIVESLQELEVVDAVAAGAGTVAAVVLRVNPSFSARGSGLTMGGKPRQFGIDQEQLLTAGPLGARHPHLRIVGVQAYMGTRILSAESVEANTRRIFTMAEEIAAYQGVELELVDVGGGLGVAYFDGEEDLDVDDLAARLGPVVEEFAVRHPRTRLVMELGRYLTALAGVYVTRVRYTKVSLGEEFAVTDGGTNHHMAAVGVGSFVKRNFPMALLSRDSDEPVGPWNISGPLCTPNDLLGKRVDLPPLRPGDLVGVLRSGAYGPSASPVYFLSHGYPAEVMVRDGRAHLVRVPDSTEDVLRGQRPLPAREPALADLMS